MKNKQLKTVVIKKRMTSKVLLFVQDFPFSFPYLNLKIELRKEGKHKLYSIKHYSLDAIE